MKNLNKVKKYEADNYFLRNLRHYNSFYQNNKIIDLINETSLQADSILEIGCANGIMLNHYSKILNSKNNYGVDFSRKAIAHGKKKFKNLKLYNYSSLEIDKLKKKFDLIICGFFLYQLDRVEIFNQFNLILKCLKKDGHLLIHDFDPLFKHSNKNVHSKKNIISYKSNYVNFLEESGLFKHIYRNRYVGKTNKKVKYKSQERSLNLFQKIEFDDVYPYNL